MAYKPGSAQPSVLIHERHFGESGRGNGQFRLPRHICALPDNRLCISDTVNQRLQVVTPEGEFLYSIGKAGAGNGELRGPSGIAWAEGPREANTTTTNSNNGISHCLLYTSPSPRDS